MKYALLFVVIVLVLMGVVAVALPTPKPVIVIPRDPSTELFCYGDSHGVSCYPAPWATAYQDEPEEGVSTERSAIAGYRSNAVIENHNLSTFTVYVPGEESELLPGHEVSGKYVFVCPKCGTRGHEPEHGVQWKCDCGLHYLSHGNNLQVSDTDFGHKYRTFKSRAEGVES